MKRLLTLMAVVFSLGLTTAAMDAEAAKRMGSGKSMGTQRQATPDKAPAAATPAAGAAVAVLDACLAVVAPFLPLPLACSVAALIACAMFALSRPRL